jgi:hypothetical protein
MVSESSPNTHEEIGTKNTDGCARRRSRHERYTTDPIGLSVEERSPTVVSPKIGKMTAVIPPIGWELKRSFDSELYFGVADRTMLGRNLFKQDLLPHNLNQKQSEKRRTSAQLRQETLPEP